MAAIGNGGSLVLAHGVIHLDKASILAVLAQIAIPAHPKNLT